MWQIAHSIKGLAEAAKEFDIPVVSGNVSLYNQTHGQGIQPTPTLAVVGLLDDASKAVSSSFKNDGDVVFLIGETSESDLGGSAYLAEIHAIEGGQLPSLNYALEKRTCDAIRSLIDKRLLESCHDLSQGGLAVALAEACFCDYTPARGVTIACSNSKLRADAVLFAESGGRFLISCKPEKADVVRTEITNFGLSITAEGNVGGDVIRVENVAQISAHRAYNTWRHGLDELFGD
jgi:phosphoribosylformylglycinamidine synthase